MPTLRGWVFLAVSAAVAAAGLVRDELGAMVWGIALLLVQLVVVLAAVVGGARLRRARDGFAVELAEPVVEAGGSARVRVTAPRLALPPGFVLTHDLALAWRGRRLAGSAEARPAATTDWRLAVGARGDYRSTSSVLSLRDVFGFTASRIAAPATMRLAVLPADPGDAVPLPARRGGAIAAERADLRVRSDELREVRPYVPGDDTRRVSWKHLATHRQLLVRVGEMVPPTRGEVVVTVDDHVPPGADRDIVGDALMAALRAIAREADEAGERLVCRFPGRSAPVVLDGATLRSGRAAGALDAPGPSPPDVAAALAGFVPGEPDSAASVAGPGPAAGPARSVAGPGSAGPMRAGAGGPSPPAHADRTRGPGVVLTARRTGSAGGPREGVVSVAHLLLPVPEVRVRRSVFVRDAG